MDKILIVKTSALGDIVHTYPVIDYLHKKFPLAQIDWVVEEPFVGLVQSHPAINRVVTVSTKEWRKKIFCQKTFQSIAKFRKQLQNENYDVVFDFQGNIKSGLIVSLANSPIKVGFGKKTVPEWPNLLFTNRHINPASHENIRQDYLSLAASFFDDPIPKDNSHVVLKISSEEQKSLEVLVKNKPGPCVIVCPGSAWQNKQVSSETLGAFLSLLHAHLNCHFLLVWGTSEEKIKLSLLQKEFTGHSQIVDKMSLPMLQNLMALSDLVIAMDSLPLHLAGTTTTPTFSVFGASSASKYKPLGTHHHAFQGTCPYGRSFVKRCPILRTCKTGACIRGLEAQELFQSFQPWWDKQDRKNSQTAHPT